MDRQMKPTFTENPNVAFAKQAENETKDLGIEFMHFDTEDL